MHVVAVKASVLDLVELYKSGFKKKKLITGKIYSITNLIEVVI